jgi:hypothetical protein
VRIGRLQRVDVTPAKVTGGHQIRATPSENRPILSLVRVSYYWLREQTWLHQKRSLTPAPPELSVVMSHWPQPKLSRTSPTQRPSSGPDPRENSGAEIDYTSYRLR